MKEKSGFKNCSRHLIALCAFLFVLLISSNPQVCYASSKNVVKDQSQKEFTIKGKVTDEGGNIMPGVNVSIKGQNVGTATDINGLFSLKVKEGDVLVVSFMGMKTKEVKVKGKKSLTIILEEDRIAVEEVIVTGLGTKKKNEFTGSVVTVKKEKLEQVPVPSVEQVLQGNVAGLSSVSVDGQPGAASQIRIRGVGSISASNAPLYVIDGVPVVSGDLSRNTSSSNVLAGISANDIENVTVLKDASATSIYGARGANGVIVITTKKGMQGKTQINIDIETGYNDLATEGPRGMTTKEWETVCEEALKNGKYGSFIGSSNFPTWKELEGALLGIAGWDSKISTNWNEEILRDKAKQSQANISMRGGNNKTNFFTSVNVFNQEGIVKNSDFERISGLLNLNTRINEKVSVQTKLNISHSQQHSLEGGGAFANPIMAKYFVLPFDRAYNEDGSIYLPASGRMSNGLFNPVYVLNNDFKDNKVTKIFGNVQGFYRPIENLKYTVKMGLDYNSLEENQYQNPTHGDGASVGGRAFSYYTRNFNWVFQNMLDYHYELGDLHKFDFKLMYEAQENRAYNMDGISQHAARPGFYYQSAYALPLATSSAFGTWTSASSMFNVNYKYNDRLYIDGTIRREGSSRFSPDNRYGNFWSAGISYRLSEEKFIKDLGFVNSLSIRTSYGVNGNAGIASNLYLAAVSYSASYNGIPVSFNSGIENPDLKWEKNKPFNIGIDFGLFSNRVSGTIDYFSRTTSDLLLSVPTSATEGRTAITKNVGEMVNKGIEVSLSTVNFNGDFNWTTDFNFTTIKNEVTEMYKLANGDYAEMKSSAKLIRKGENIESWYMKKWAGVDPNNGDPLWYINGKDGKTTNDYNKAEQAIQGSSLPDIYGGMTNTLSYKGLSLSFQLNYSLGYKIYDSWANYTNSDGEYTHAYGGFSTQMDRWTKKGDIAKCPKMVMGGNKQSNATSTRFLWDGDHIRLRNVTLNYNLPKSFLANTGIENCSVYVRGVNLYTYCFDKDLEFDPETVASGIIDFTLPNMKSITVGLKLKF